MIVNNNRPPPAVRPFCEHSPVRERAGHSYNHSVPIILFIIDGDVDVGDECDVGVDDDDDDENIDDEEEKVNENNDNDDDLDDVDDDSFPPKIARTIDDEDQDL